MQAIPDSQLTQNAPRVLKWWRKWFNSNFLVIWSYMKLNVTLKFNFNFKDQLQFYFGEEVSLKQNQR